MEWERYVYVCLYLLAFGISVSVGFLCLSRGRVQGARAYVFVAFGKAAWTFGLIGESVSRSLRWKIFWDNVQYAALAAWALAFVAFTLRYTGRRAAHPFLLSVFLGLPALAVVGLAFSDGWHGLIRSQTRLVPGEPFNMLWYEFGLPVWAGALCLYTCFGFSLFLIGLEMFRTLPPHRVQMALVMAGNLIPLAATALTLTIMRFPPDRDPSPYAIALGNFLVAWGLFRFELFGVVPMARDSMITQMQDIVLVVDARGRVVFANPAARRRFRPSGRDPVGLPLSGVFPLWAGQVSHEWPDPRARFETREGIPPEDRHFEVEIETIQDIPGRTVGWLAIVRDITARKKMEHELDGYRRRLEELVQERTRQLAFANENLLRQAALRERMEARLKQSQKMEALGRLAGGIAHDFNNLLVPILGYAELGKLREPPGTRQHAELVEIEECARRAAALIRQILAFSRNQILETHVLDLNEEVLKFTKLSTGLLGEGIRLELGLEPGLRPVRADPTQVHQVLMNLCINARDAMPKGGLLTIATSNGVWPDPGDPAAPLEPARLSSVLLVRDTGTGMDAEVVSHIFEPFFTTKGGGAGHTDRSGTGLGLASVYGIIEQHHGHIRVASSPGQGTEFRVYFPNVGAAGGGD
jgi:signal transduction histidine kinase